MDTTAIEGRLRTLMTALPAADAELLRLKDNLRMLEERKKDLEARYVASGLEGKNEREREANLRLRLGEDPEWQATAKQGQDLQHAVRAATYDAGAKHREWQFLELQLQLEAATRRAHGGPA